MNIYYSRNSITRAYVYLLANDIDMHHTTDTAYTNHDCMLHGPKLPTQLRIL